MERRLTVKESWWTWRGAELSKVGGPEDLGEDLETPGEVAARTTPSYPEEMTRERGSSICFFFDFDVGFTSLFVVFIPRNTSVNKKYND